VSQRCSISVYDAMGIGGGSKLGEPPVAYADLPREVPLQVRRGYKIAEEAATELDPDNVYLNWRAEMAGAKAYPADANPIKRLTMAGNDDPLSNPWNRTEHGKCLPLYLKNMYIRLRDSLEYAQGHAMKIAPARWYELQRIDDLTRFLTRADNNVLTKSEVGDLGEALRHARIAGANVRSNYMMPLKKEELGVPGELEGGLQDVQLFAKKLAAHGYRCRASEFLPPLKEETIKSDSMTM